MALYLITRQAGDDVDVAVVESSRKPTTKQARYYYGVDEDLGDTDNVSVQKVKVIPEAKFKEDVKNNRSEIYDASFED